MKTIIKTSLLTLSVLLISFLDFKDRYFFDSKIFDREIQNTFFNFESEEDVQKMIEKSFNNPKYKFPRKEVSYCKIYKNQFLISRITSKTLNQKDTKKLVNLLNSSENFDYYETTWDVNESEYLFRFFDKKNNEIGVLWLCWKDCGMTSSKPFSPNMNYGGLSKKGKINFADILKNYIEIHSE